MLASFLEHWWLNDLIRLKEYVIDCDNDVESFIH